VAASDAGELAPCGSGLNSKIRFTLSGLLQNDPCKAGYLQTVAALFQWLPQAEIK
jgi:hypothetical protein